MIFLQNYCGQLLHYRSESLPQFSEVFFLFGLISQYLPEMMFSYSHI